MRLYGLLEAARPRWLKSIARRSWVAVGIAVLALESSERELVVPAQSGLVLENICSLQVVPLRDVSSDCSGRPQLDRAESLALVVH